MSGTDHQRHHIHDLMLEEFVKVTDANALTPEDVYPSLIGEGDVALSSPDFTCKECHVAMKKGGSEEVYTCPQCSWVDW